MWYRGAAGFALPIVGLGVMAALVASPAAHSFLDHQTPSVKAGSANPARDAPAVAPPADLAGLHEYISNSWSTLTRTRGDLSAAAVDPKFPARQNKWPVYLSRRENLETVERELAALLPAAALARISFRHLPPPGTRIIDHGLLYLPYPYVVPGGRFNEMYGWDSYFILRGLLREGKTALAQNMVDNAIYQVVHFGKVLNANRTYYLERSQPPFITKMIRELFAVTRDRRWLTTTLPAIRTQYQYWVTKPHMAGTTGLSRYHALGAGPAPEVVAGEKDSHGKDHYQRVRAALRADDAATPGRNQFYDRRSERLTPLFYLADRSMRESGFDPTDRFGRFSTEILQLAPVCLNSLLFAMEEDMAYLLGQLDQTDEAATWSRRGERRRHEMRSLLWDEGRGIFSDYDFVGRQRKWYPFAATFFPLWVGVATPQQARRLAATALPLLAAAGGLSTSSNVSGNQWDAPYGWAPLQLVAVEGLRRYGMDQEADALALSFLGTVLKEYVEHGAVFEKYDVARRESDVEAGLRFGYTSNEIGFGWTNGVFLELEAGLAPAKRGDIAKAAGLRLR